MKRETTILEAWLVIFLLGMFAVLFSGCTTTRTQFYCGQAADLSTTYYALEMDGNYYEQNPLADDFQDVLLMKAAYVGVVELFAYLWPEQAETFYFIGAIGGYAPAAYNMVQLGR